MTLIMAFLAAENESRQPENLPQAAFGCVPERFLLSVRTKSITENFLHWILRPLFVFVVIQWIFSSRTLAPTHFEFFFSGIVDPLIFIRLYSRLFLSVTGYLCLYVKQNNAWLLVHMEFLFSCSIRHHTRSLRSLVSCRVRRSKRNSILTRLFIILYFISRAWDVLNLYLSTWKHLRSSYRMKILPIVFFILF